MISGEVITGVYITDIQIYLGYLDFFFTFPFESLNIMKAHCF